MRLRHFFKKLWPSLFKRQMPGFDETYYLKCYPSVRHFTGTPLQHYLQHGWKDGCDPSAGFSSNGYLAANPEVAVSGLSPLAHFLSQGLAEGRVGWQKSAPLSKDISTDQGISKEWFFENNTGLPLIFMYWESSVMPKPPSATYWQKIYPNFKVFTEQDVTPLLPKNFVDLFQLIRFPAAKSDIARIFLLQEYGGLYVDAHVGPASPSHLLMTLSRLAGCSVMLFGRKWKMDEDADFLDLMNTIIAARQGAPELAIIANRLVANVWQQRHKEDATSEYTPYDLHYLTGTWLLVEAFLEIPALTPKIKPEFSGKLAVNILDNPEHPGFELYKFQNYRQIGNHWSERQRYERFFRDKE
ncbi:hypothetical protein FHR71_000867 [Methylobacterium sp. RAS18]|nr:hypothetical protein [Methylobacterium sp. RAS18]